MVSEASESRNTAAGVESTGPASVVRTLGSSDLDLFDILAQPNNLQDPYPFYAWLRSNRPVHTDPDGTVYLSRYEDAVHLRDPDLRTAPVDDSRSFALHTFNQTMVKAVAPRHGALRRVAGVAFDRRLLARAGERMRRTAENLAEQLATRLAAEGSADLHAEYSLPFTQRAAATVFGIPDEDFDQLAAMPARIFAPLYPKTTPTDWAQIATRPPSPTPTPSTPGAPAGHDTSPSAKASTPASATNWPESSSPPPSPSSPPACPVSPSPAGPPGARTPPNASAPDCPQQLPDPPPTGIHPRVQPRFGQERP
ncbi:hypothetical protein [Streptosporangium sp. NPDC003464]